MTKSRLLGCLLLVAAGAGATSLFSEDFETGQIVGAQPTGATRVRPTTNTPTNFVRVVAGVDNGADDGVGKGVRIHDADATPTALEYDVIGSGQTGLSQFGVAFDFAYVSGSGSDQITFSGGARGDALTSSSRRWFAVDLEANGTVEGVNVNEGSSHQLFVFVNDSDVDAMNYSAFGVSGTLAANSVAVYVDGTLERESLLSGSVVGSSNNFGRIGFNSYSSAVHIDYVIDNLQLIEMGSVSATNTSGLVYAGEDGLVYAPYANEGDTNAVNTVPDFSSAGYDGGGASIPFVPAAITVTNGPGDDTALIQNAINQVSAMPLGVDGFRGAVLLTAGDYTVSSTLALSVGGVVMRGEGSSEVGGTRITYTATAQTDLFEVGGGGSPSEVSGTRRAITDAYVPVGAISFQVSDASIFSVGDAVRVQNLMNQQWIDDLDMAQWGWTASGYQLTFRRVITAIEGNQVTLDAPIVQAIDPRYGGGVLYQYDFASEIAHVGFEGLRLESTYASDEDEQHGWTAINMMGVRNGWVRQVTARYFGYSLVSILSNSRHITVEDCAMLDPKSITTGGRKYSFNIDDSDSVLVQRCFTRGGRHDFVSGSKTPGPNVFVDCLAVDTHSDIGPHHRYATGQLYDNIQGGAIHVQNREDSGSGHGWSGAQVMFWNCDADSLISDAPVGAMNWCVGSVGNKNEGQWAPQEPFGIWDSHNAPVLPRSLYYTQLAERAGGRAVRNILLPEQVDADIWSRLDAWAGEGLLLARLIAWNEGVAYSGVDNPIFVRGIVRDLQWLEKGFTVEWSQSSGPGTALFSDHAALETLVAFSMSGSYELVVTISDGVSQLASTVAVEVTTEPAATALYAEWLADYPALGGRTNYQDDAEPDGVDNLLEYALNGDPTSPDAEAVMPRAWLVAQPGSNALHYGYARRSDHQLRGLSYTVRSGRDLGAEGWVDEVPVHQVSPTTNGFEHVEHRLPTDVQTNGFMGLEVELVE